MNSSLCPWSKGLIRAEALRLGAVAFGCSVAGPVDAEYRRGYERWLAEGRAGSMAYLANYPELRFDPRKLLHGAKTVISMAFPYRPAGGYHHPHIADYALGQDYHYVVKDRLQRLAAFIFEHFGAQSRACVDSAPILERYWAEKSGLGWRGLNGQLIVPDVGSGVFLGELVTTLELAPDAPIEGHCGHCGACVRVCPGGAIGPDGSFDARRCLSYLSIEHKGGLPDDVRFGRRVYGCDSCQRVCRHNRCEPPEPLPEFYPDARLLKLDREALSHLTPGDWRRLTAHSAMRRIPLKQLLKIINLGR